MMLKRHLEILAQDLRHAGRGFVRSPTFTLTAVATLALGVGAGTAVFSVVDRILFRSLPYPDAGRLVSVGITAPVAPQEFMLGYDYLDWHDAQTPFESLGAWSGEGDCDLTGADPVRLRCVYVDPYFLPTLGIRPIAGRNFTPDEDEPKAPKTALLSNALWRNRFGGDRGIIGRTIPLDGRFATVIGVLPPGFEMPTLAQADLLVPMALDKVEQRSRRTATLLAVVGRLKSGVGIPQATAALGPMFNKVLESISPEFRKDVKLRLRSLHDRQIREARLASWILLAAVLAVLAIACANVANLLLARATARQREIAVRAALGAGRGRLVRQTLTESMLLGLTGGVGGCAIAFGLLRLFVAIAPKGIPRLEQAGLDLRVLLFTLAASLVSGVLFGLAPALQAVRLEALSGSRAIGARRQVFRQALVAAQICVSLILLTGASLLLRSLWNLQSQPLGMRTDAVLTAAVTLGRNTYPDPARRAEFFEEMEARLRRIPGVADVAVTDAVPPDASPAGWVIYGAIDVPGRPRFTDGTGGRVTLRSVTPRYFAALGIPILRGRAFSEEDRDPDRNVVIISDSLARRLFPGEDPLEKQIQRGRVGAWRTIIGVAANVKNNGLVERNEPEMYEVRKHASAAGGRSATAIVRAAADPRKLAGAVRAEIGRMDSTLPVEIATLDQRLSKLAERPRFNAALLGLFAAMGLLLAVVGLYGVCSYLVSQRTQEIGVRMALGAAPGTIARLVLMRAAAWTAAGEILGVVGSLFAGRLIRSMLFDVSPNSPWMLASALVILLGTALLAAWIPSRRAARIDPAQALRQE